jgi:hypothetical protein
VLEASSRLRGDVLRPWGILIVLFHPLVAGCDREGFASSSPSPRLTAAKFLARFIVRQDLDMACKPDRHRKSLDASIAARPSTR